MVYKMILTGDRGEQFVFQGIKLIHKDHAGEIGLKDTNDLLCYDLFRYNVLGNSCGKSEVIYYAVKLCQATGNAGSNQHKKQIEKVEMHLAIWFVLC